MSFIDQHRPILRKGYPTLLHPINDATDLTIEVFCQAVFHIHLIGFELLPAPIVEVIDLDTIGNGFRDKEVTEPCGQRNIETQHQNRFVQRLSKIEATKRQNQGLPGTRNTMNYPMSLSETSRQNLLLNIHDLDDVRQHVYILNFFR
ncbi:hypothetical protein D3C76_954220 [compost metagenome]